MTESRTRYDTRTEVDAVIIGSGAAGGVLARELSVAGLSVVVLEQGPYRKSADFTHDELAVMIEFELFGGWPGQDPQTFRTHAGDVAAVPQQLPPALYARTVGGASVHFSGNCWRLRPVDFNERSRLGAMSGTGFADWPFDYDEMEPYYTRVEQEIGVSGAPGPFDPPRSRPYPLPPFRNKPAGVLFERGAKALGMHPQVAPVAILSRAYRGRPGCINCGFCMGFGCEVNAKSSTLATMIPEAEATGRCEIRPLSTVTQLELDRRGRISEVVYRDAAGVEQAQRARIVILAANGAETPRLLLMSASPRAPHGLANSSGKVGRYLMFNSHGMVRGVFEHPLNEYKGIQCTRLVHDFYETDSKRGFYGGGGIDARPGLDATPLLYALAGGLPPDTPPFGSGLKQALAHHFTRNMTVMTAGTSVPLDSNNITLDPELKDRYGRPVVRVTYRDHADDLKLQRFLVDKGAQILDAAGAQKVWADPVRPQEMGTHLLGTCRMGDDPEESVVDRHHRAHDVRNLFICDGSSMVSSGRGQPTMTIMALAFRAAEHIAGFARRGEI